ncbi:hypothetical protein D9M68_161460 [compost metagenome]
MSLFTSTGSWQMATPWIAPGGKRFAVFHPTVRDGTLRTRRRVKADTKDNTALHI